MVLRKETSQLIHNSELYGLVEDSSTISRMNLSVQLNLTSVELTKLVILYDLAVIRGQNICIYLKRESNRTKCVKMAWIWKLHKKYCCNRIQQKTVILSFFVENSLHSGYEITTFSSTCKFQIFLMRLLRLCFKPLCSI